MVIIHVEIDNFTSSTVVIIDPLHGAAILDF